MVFNAAAGYVPNCMSHRLTCHALFSIVHPHPPSPPQPSPPPPSPVPLFHPFSASHSPFSSYSRLHIGISTPAIMAEKQSSSRVISTFAEGSWGEEVQTKYDGLVAYHSALDPSRAPRRSKPLSGSADKSVDMVKDFFANVPSWENYGGMAAWYEPSEAVASWMSQRCPKVKAELARRSAFRKGKLIFRLTYMRGQRYQPLVWHTLVAEDCSMEALKDAVTTSGKMCFSRARGVNLTFFGTGKFRLRQCNGEFLQAGEALTTVLNIRDFIAVNGVYHVFVSGSRTRANGKAKGKASSAAVVKQTPSPPPAQGKVNKKTIGKGKSGTTTVKETPPPSPPQESPEQPKQTVGTQLMLTNTSLHSFLVRLPSFLPSCLCNTFVVGSLHSRVYLSSLLPSIEYVFLMCSNFFNDHPTFTPTPPYFLNPRMTPPGRKSFPMAPATKKFLQYQQVAPPLVRRVLTF